MKLNKQSVSSLCSCDEMTDVSGETQLLAFARYKDASDIKKHIFILQKNASVDILGKKYPRLKTPSLKTRSLKNVICSPICTAA